MPRIFQVVKDFLKNRKCNHLLAQWRIAFVFGFICRKFIRKYVGFLFTDMWKTANKNKESAIFRETDTCKDCYPVT